jgi:hypothetical protein
MPETSVSDPLADLRRPDGTIDLTECTPENWLCIDCGVNTAPGLPTRIEIEKAWEANPDEGIKSVIDDKSEVYYVRDAVWAKAGMDGFGGCLCIGCLEKRIGRRLKPKDFLLSHAFNSPRIPGTKRLMDRRGKPKGLPYCRQ